MKRLFAIAASPFLLLAGLNIAAAQNEHVKNNTAGERDLAALNTGGHTCTSAIDKWKAGLADNWNSIIGSGKAYSDKNFTGAATVTWSDYPNNQYPLSSYISSSTWGTLKSKIPSAVLFAVSAGPSDVDQGVDSDCYVLSAAAGVAQNAQRIKNVFLTQTYPSEGIFALKVFVRGKPTIVTVDDNFPFYYNQLLFSKPSSVNNGIWTAVLEKGYAKVSGNYEYAQVGSPLQSFKFMNGAPSFSYYTTSQSVTTAWNLLKTAFQRNFHAVATTGNTAPAGLTTFHCHSIMGTYELKDPSGNVVKRLVRIRDPWGADTKYTGNWNDNYAGWTAQYKAQVPFVVDKNDGYFLIEDVDFLKGFQSFEINYFSDNWQNSYYEVLADASGAQRTWSFTTTSAMELYVHINFYDPRMYSTGCKPSSAQGTILIFKGSSQIAGVMFTDQWGGSGTQYFPSLAAGTYQIKFKPTWTTADVRDYTVNIYAPQNVQILDANGNTNQA